MFALERVHSVYTMVTLYIILQRSQTLQVGVRMGGTHCSKRVGDAVPGVVVYLYL